MNIKTERRKQLLTQKDLAVKSGVGSGTIARLESGKVLETEVGTLLKVLKALNIRPSYFFTNYD